jgi:hypothetical protein
MSNRNNERKERNERKEVRGMSLFSAIRKALPHIGNLKLDPKGRKATCIWRNTPFVISSRLAVREQGFAALKNIETADSAILQSRLKG